MINTNEFIENLNKKFVLWTFTENELKTMINKEIENEWWKIDKQDFKKIFWMINKSQSEAWKKVSYWINKSIENTTSNTTSLSGINLQIPNISDHKSIKAKTQTKYWKKWDEIKSKSENKMVSQSSKTATESSISWPSKTKSGVVKKIAIWSVSIVLWISWLLWQTDEEKVKLFKKPSPSIETTASKDIKKAAEQIITP